MTERVRAEHDRTYRTKHKLKCNEQSRERGKKIRQLKAQFVTAYLENHPCVDCGEHDPIVLDFDHVSGEKINTVSSILGSGKSLVHLVVEIEKCVVRCANCHRRKTAQQRGWIYKLQSSNNSTGKLS